MKVKKVELIVPAISEKYRNQKKALTPPLGLAMIAALTPSDVEVSITDENISEIDFEQKPDLVGITTLTITSQRAYDIAKQFKDRNKEVKVVLGGIHASMLPDEARKHADAVVIGEAEEIWPELIEDLKKTGTLKKEYKKNNRPNLDNLPLPRRDLFIPGRYIFPNTIATTRGCPYSCSFCTVTSYFGHSYRCRPVQEVVKEIETLNKNEIIIFVDDNIVGKPDYAKELFKALIKYKIKWASQASVTIGEDKNDELLELAAESGCIDLLIGFESLYQPNLVSVSKKINTSKEKKPHELYEKIIRNIHSKGIGIHGFFIFGFDGDDENTFESTVRFAQKMRLESAQFDILTPYPGTNIHKSFDRDGRIVTKDWSQYGHDLMFVPKSMSREKLQKGRTLAWRKFYSLLSICRRIGVIHPNWLKFWVLNLFYFYQIHVLRKLH